METEEYRGAVFPPNGNNQRQSAEIVLDEDKIVARTVNPDGVTQEFQILWHEAAINFGGANGTMLFVRPALADSNSTSHKGGLTICCDAPSLRQDLHQLAERSGHVHILDVLRQHRSKRSRGRMGCFLALVITVAVLWWTPTIWRASVSQAVEALPAEVDQQIGELAWSNMGASLDLIEVAEVDQAFAQMMDQIYPAFGEQPWDIQIFVANEAQINAFAIPGGTIVFHSGLIFAADSAEEVAGVLAHEIAHVTHRHSLHGIADSLGIIIAAQLLLGDFSGVIAVAAEVLTMAALNSRSQSAEAEADSTAASALYHSGIDPRVLASFFEQLRDRYGDNTAAEYWMSTHPSHQDRISAVEAQASELEAQLGPLQVQSLSIDWAAVQSALAEAGAAGQNAATPKTSTAD